VCDDDDDDDVVVVVISVVFVFVFVFEERRRRWLAVVEVDAAASSRVTAGLHDSGRVHVVVVVVEVAAFTVVCSSASIAIRNK